jgi:hypothetical protein
MERRAGLAPAVAALSASAGVVHLSVAGEHLREDVHFGGFFIALAVFQLAWAALVVTRPDRRVYRIGAAVNGAVILVWLLSRTAGIPFGPHAGVPEAVGMADLVSTGLELGVIAGGIAALGATGRALTAAARVLVVLAFASVPLTAFASTAGPHHAVADAHPHPNADAHPREADGHPHDEDDGHSHDAADGEIRPPSGG